MAIISSHEGEKLVFDASTETGTVELVSGKMFVGGEYPVELLVNGAMDSHVDDPCLVTLYIYSDSTPIRLSQCYPSYPGHNTITLNQTQLINAFRAHGVSRLDSVEAEVFVSSVEQVPYEDEEGNALVKEVAHVYAQGKTKIYWSPAIGFEQGLPVDTRGDVGPSGVWVGEEPPPEGSDYLVWVKPREEPKPYIDYTRMRVDDTPGVRRLRVNMPVTTGRRSTDASSTYYPTTFVEFLVRDDAYVYVRGHVAFELPNINEDELTPVPGVVNEGELWFEYVRCTARQTEHGPVYERIDHYPIRIYMEPGTAEWDFEIELPVQGIITDDDESEDNVSELFEDGTFVSGTRRSWTRYRVSGIGAFEESMITLSNVVYTVSPFNGVQDVNGN